MIGMGALFLVCEGELWHSGYVPHVVYPQREQAVAYARDLAEQLEGARWPNVYIYQMQLGEPGATPLELEDNAQ